jgi:hypothetical protein
MPGSRLEALERGLKKYYTGKPCAAGHVSTRWTLSGSCVQCQKDAAAKNVSKMRDRLKIAEVKIRAPHWGEVKDISYLFGAIEDPVPDYRIYRVHPSQLAGFLHGLSLLDGVVAESKYQGPRA